MAFNKILSDWAVWSLTAGGIGRVVVRKRLPSNRPVVPGSSHCHAGHSHTELITRVRNNCCLQEIHTLTGFIHKYFIK